jgi:hypothetical protein
MQKDAKQEEPLSPEVQDVMKHLVSAIRVVKMYPSNNPVYSQSVKKAFTALSHFLETNPEYRVGVQKSYFTYFQTPVAKEAQVNKSIAQDVFLKGVRDVIFSPGITEEELLTLFRSLALLPEELMMKNGIATLLWERGATHIKVTEAGLDDVISTKAASGAEGDDLRTGSASRPDKAALSGRTLVLSDLKTDPEGFGSLMLEYAKRTKTQQETIEDRLYTLYQKAGRKIQQEHTPENEVLFEGLARSVLALNSPHREALISGKLYADVDDQPETDADQESLTVQPVPNPVHEVRTGRFSNSWKIEEVAALLKRSTAKPDVVPAPAVPGPFRAEPLPEDLLEIARSLQEDNQEQRVALKAISEAGMETDIIESAVRTLIAVVPDVRHDGRPGSQEQEVSLFAGVIQQLEDILGYLRKKNDYNLATMIVNSFHTPVPPQFQPRMREALKRTATTDAVKDTIAEMQKLPKGSAAYRSVYTYVSSLERKATEALLELLAGENDRETRIFLLDLMKDFCKDEVSLLSEYLTDERWYVIRNVVSILAENKTEQAVGLLRKAADHKNPKIRQEVIKALQAAGGKRAALVLSKFLRDDDKALQLNAIHAYGDMPGIGADEAKYLVEFLQDRTLKKKEQELVLAAIRALGRIGGDAAAVFLHTFTRVRWWRSRRLQVERRDAALRSIEEISRRQSHGGRARR